MKNPILLTSALFLSALTARAESVEITCIYPNTITKEPLTVVSRSTSDTGGEVIRFADTRENFRAMAIVKNGSVVRMELSDIDRPDRDAMFNGKAEMAALVLINPAFYGAVWCGPRTVLETQRKQRK